MVINHYYLHTCFVFVLINTGLIRMRIASVRIPKTLKQFWNKGYSQIRTEDLTLINKRFLYQLS